ETVRQHADNRPLEPADMIDVGDDAFARDAAHRADDGHAAGRHVEHLTGKLTPVGQHVAAKQVHAHALEAALFLVQGKNVEYFLQHGHAASSPPHSTLAAQERTACIVKALLMDGPQTRPPSCTVNVARRTGPWVPATKRAAVGISGAGSRWRTFPSVNARSRDTPSQNGALKGVSAPI